MADVPIIIADYNDYSGVVGPIRGLDPDTGERELYHGTDITVFITAATDSDTPIGTLTYAANEIGETAKYPFGFDGADIATSMAALADGTKVYRVVRNGDGSIRIWRELTYKKTRESRL
jgi:acetoacetate decarboxylase